MKRYSFGVDVGGTACKFGIFESNGNLLEKWETKTDTRNSGAFVLDNITKSIQDKCSEKNISLSEVQGVGLGVPGPVMEDGTVKKCVNLGWGVFNVEKSLSEKLHLPVKAANDANMAALGEMWQGCAKGCGNLIMVTLGTGIGGGVIINSKIVIGHYGAAGELGHIKIGSSYEAPCSCGKKGCLEQYASAAGIARVARQRLAASDVPSSLRDFKQPTAKNIFDEAKNGDLFALELVDFLGETLGRAFANISCVIDPQIFAIGGGLSKAGSILSEAVERNFRAHAFHASEEARIELSCLGNDAGIYGGAYLVFQ